MDGDEKKQNVLRVVPQAALWTPRIYQKWVRIGWPKCQHSPPHQHWPNQNLYAWQNLRQRGDCVPHIIYYLCYFYIYFIDVVCNHNTRKTHAYRLRLYCIKYSILMIYFIHVACGLQHAIYTTCHPRELDHNFHMNYLQFFCNSVPFLYCSQIRK